jgi:hypothetical protein
LILLLNLIVNDKNSIYILYIYCFYNIEKRDVFKIKKSKRFSYIFIDNIKEASAIYLEKIVNKRINQKKNIELDQRLSEIRKFIEILKTEATTFKIKTIVKDILGRLILPDQGNFIYLFINKNIYYFIIFCKFLDFVFLHIFPQITKLIESQTIIECLSGLLLTQCVIENKDFQPKSQLFLYKISGGMNNFLAKTLILLKEKIYIGKDHETIKKLYRFFSRN